MFLQESVLARSEAVSFVPQPVAQLAGSTALASEQIPDLRVLIPEAQAGDEAATQALHILTQSIISGKLRRYSGDNLDKDNIGGAVTEKMLTAAFDPHWPLPEDTPPEQERKVVYRRYSAYIGKAIRTVIADTAEPAVPTDLAALADCTPAGEAPQTQKPVHENGDATAALPAELVKSILSERQFQLFELSRSGHPYTEISGQMGLTIAVIKKAMRGTIAQLERHILEPGGLQRAYQVAQKLGISQSAMQGAITAGTVQAVKILHRWYVKPEWTHSLKPPENAVLLGKIASNATLLALQRHHPERIIRHYGRVYISAQDIAMVEAMNAEKAQTRLRVTPPEPGYVLANDVARNLSEVHRLRAAFRNGEFSRVIARRRSRFVPQAEAEAILEQFRSSQSGSPERAEQA